MDRRPISSADRSLSMCLFTFVFKMSQRLQCSLRFHLVFVVAFSARFVCIYFIDSPIRIADFDTFECSLTSNCHCSNRYQQHWEIMNESKSKTKGNSNRLFDPHVEYITRNFFAGLATFWFGESHIVCRREMRN